jgi:hypothetical protein
MRRPNPLLSAIAPTLLVVAAVVTILSGLPTVVDTTLPWLGSRVNLFFVTATIWQIAWVIPLIIALALLVGIYRNSRSAPLAGVRMEAHGHKGTPEETIARLSARVKELETQADQGAIKTVNQPDHEPKGSTVSVPHVDYVTPPVRPVLVHSEITDSLGKHELSKGLVTPPISSQTVVVGAHRSADRCHPPRLDNAPNEVFLQHLRSYCEEREAILAAGRALRDDLWAVSTHASDGDGLPLNARRLKWLGTFKAHADTWWPGETIPRLLPSDQASVPPAWRQQHLDHLVPRIKWLEGVAIDCAQASIRSAISSQVQT